MKFLNCFVFLGAVILFAKFLFFSFFIFFDRPFDVLVFCFSLWNLIALGMIVFLLFKLKFWEGSRVKKVYNEYTEVDFVFDDKKEAEDKKLPFILIKVVFVNVLLLLLIWSVKFYFITPFNRLIVESLIRVGQLALYVIYFSICFITLKTKFWKH